MLSILDHRKCLPYTTKQNFLPWHSPSEYSHTEGSLFPHISTSQWPVPEFSLTHRPDSVFGEPFFHLLSKRCPPSDQMKSFSFGESCWEKSSVLSVARYLMRLTHLFCLSWRSSLRPLEWERADLVIVQTNPDGLIDLERQSPDVEVFVLVMHGDEWRSVCFARREGVVPVQRVRVQPVAASPPRRVARDTCRRWRRSRVRFTGLWMTAKTECQIHISVTARLQPPRVLHTTKSHT